MIVTLSLEHGDPFVRDEGTVVVLQGLDMTGRMLRFAVDHRAAGDLLQSVVMDDEDVEVEVESWQILGRAAVVSKRPAEIVAGMLGDDVAEWEV